jgi:hypothetical protein
MSNKKIKMDKIDYLISMYDNFAFWDAKIQENNPNQDRCRVILFFDYLDRVEIGGPANIIFQHCRDAIELLEEIRLDIFDEEILDFFKNIKLVLTNALKNEKNYIK